MTSPTVTIESITPTQAEQWLALNNHNRNLKDSYVHRLASAMERGEWQLNGASISLNGGMLIDGQHRLAAIVQSGVTIKTLVVRDLPANSQETIDTGSRRTLSDVLKLRGEVNTSTLGSALTSLYQLKNGRMLSGTRDYPTVQQSLALLGVSPTLRESVLVAMHVRRYALVPTGMMASLHYWFSELDAEDADFFFNRLADGVNLEEGSPILVLRHFFERQNGMPNGSRLAYRHVAAVVIKAWNAYRAGNIIDRLRWVPGGSKPEAFPTPI